MEVSQVECEESLPTVSVVIPCRDEEDFIESCLRSILQGTYPQEAMEILVVDGRSEDGTRSIVRRLSDESPNIRLIENPSGRIPDALNLGITNASADLFLRMDAHTTYEPDYIERCVRTLQEHDAENVGGVVRTVPRRDNFIGRAIASVSSHPFGVGNSVFRVGARTVTEVDTVPFGCYRIRSLKELGGYRSELTRSQDFELNLRIRGRGGRIILDPSIVANYMIRATVPSFARHRIRDGFWAVYALRYGVRTFGLRHLAPLALVLALLAFTGVGIVWDSWTLLTSLVGAYLLAVALASIHLAFRDGSVALIPPAMLLFPLLHIGYGAGSCAGLLAAAGGALLDSLRLHET